MRALLPITHLPINIPSLPRLNSNQFAYPNRLPRFILLILCEPALLTFGPRLRLTLLPSVSFHVLALFLGVFERGVGGAVDVFWAYSDTVVGEVLIYRMRLANSGHSSVFKHTALGACLHDDRWIVLFQTGGVSVRGSSGSLLGT